MAPLPHSTTHNQRASRHDARGSDGPRIPDRGVFRKIAGISELMA